MVARAVELEQPAIALTDHGNLHGAIDFFQAAKKVGIKPIIGVEDIYSWIFSYIHVTYPRNDMLEINICLFVLIIDLVC